MLLPLQTRLCNYNTNVIIYYYGELKPVNEYKKLEL